MRAFESLLLACASLAVSARRIYEISLDFDKGCVEKCGSDFTDLDSARKCIETVPRIAGKCEYVRLNIMYVVEHEETVCPGFPKGFMEAVPLGDFARDLSDLDYESIQFRTASFDYLGSMRGDCRAATLVGTGDQVDSCTNLTQEAYPMKTYRLSSGLYFVTTVETPADKFTDLALQARFGENCSAEGELAEVRLVLTVTKAIRVAIKDATIVFPDQSDCAPSGCEAVIGTKGVKACLDNAQAAPNCKRAVYTRTYFNLDNDRCDPAVPEKIHLNMDHILADDEALNFEDKHTSVTRIQFAQKPEDNNCSGSFLRFTNSCSAEPSVISILREDSESSFTFVGDEEVTAGLVATNYTLTTGCGLIDSPVGGEVTMKTHFTISHPTSSFTFTGEGKSTTLLVLSHPTTLSTTE